MPSVMYKGKMEKKDKKSVPQNATSGVNCDAINLIRYTQAVIILKTLCNCEMLIWPALILEFTLLETCTKTI